MHYELKAFQKFCDIRDAILLNGEVQQNERGYVANMGAYVVKASQAKYEISNTKANWTAWVEAGMVKFDGIDWDQFMDVNPYKA